MPKITMDGKYQTRDGWPARVLCVDAEDGQPVVALVDGNVYRYTDDGFFWNSRRKNDADLIPIPEKRTVDYWLNVYEGCSYQYFSKEQADKASDPSRLACLHIVREYTVGEGL